MNISCTRTKKPLMKEEIKEIKKAEKDFIEYVKKLHKEKPNTENSVSKNTI